MAKTVTVALMLFFTAIHKWLDKKFEDESYNEGGGVRNVLLEAFDIYMVS